MICSVRGKVARRASVSTDPSPKPKSLDAFQSVWYRLALLFFAASITAFWFVLGPANPWYALMVAWGTCSLVAAVPVPMMRRAPGQWLRVPAGERVLHRIVGVGAFAWLLDVSGWNRNVPERLRGFSGNKAGLASLEQQARAGAIAHGACFAIHVLLAVLALFTRRARSGALWMLLPGVVLHLYPVLLQRSLMLRLRPMVEKTRSWCLVEDGAPRQR